MGQGFAFVGLQYPLMVGDSDFCIDVLFHHPISEQSPRLSLPRGFVESPTKPMTLCLVVANLAQALRET